MAYDNDVPLGSDTISATQQPIHDNFAAIDTVFAVDHVGFNMGDEGEHKQVTMAVQTVPSAPAADTGIVYTKTDGTNAQLWFRNAVADLPLGAGDQNTSANGYTVLPGGIILNWGTISSMASATVPVVFAQPYATACFGVQITASVARDHPYRAQDVMTTGFNSVTATSGGTSSYSFAYWFAVGI